MCLGQKDVADRVRACATTRDDAPYKDAIRAAINL